MIDKTINNIGILHGYFLDLLDISIPMDMLSVTIFSI